MALVGDSEIFQNLFGQTRVLDRDGLAQHVGTYVFVEPLTGWLLGISDPEWPPLPSGFTWIALDGDINDWPTNVPMLQDTSSTIPFYAITQVRALRRPSRSRSSCGGLIVTLPGRTQLQVFGTNAARDWLFVRSGRYEGWMALFLVALNADVNRLPVLNPDGTPAELTP